MMLLLVRPMLGPPLHAREAIHSAADDHASDIDGLSDDAPMQEDMLSFFQVDTSFPPRRLDGELEQLWEESY